MTATLSVEQTVITENRRTALRSLPALLRTISWNGPADGVTDLLAENDKLRLQHDRDQEIIDGFSRALRERRRVEKPGPHTGSVIDKVDVRDVLIHLLAGTQFSAGDLGMEQATNRICALQRQPKDLQEIALTVSCPYCGRTAGNPCRRGDQNRAAHPSRLRSALQESAA